MSRLTHKDVERLLQLRPAPRPPAHLAARILAEIPDRIEVGTQVRRDQPQAEPTLPSPPHRLMMLAAASLVLTAGLSALLVTVMPALAVAPPHRQAAVTLVSRDSRPAIQVLASQTEPEQVTIEVTVLGPDDTPRAGARVELEPVDGVGRPVELTTDRRGWARAHVLAPGTYRLHCALANGIAATDEVTVHAGEQAALLLVLDRSQLATEPLA